MITNKSQYSQDPDGQWWYYDRRQRYRAIVRACSDCGKEELVRETKHSAKCKSCALKGLRKTEYHKANLKKNSGKRGTGKGKYRTNHGYIKIRQEDHPFADKDGFVEEHRVVMEELIGRPLTSKEVVHHINGRKSDNRPSNLWLFSSRREHMQYHNHARQNTKKPHYVYLGGSISSDPKTYQWREEFKSLMKKETLMMKLQTLDPCANRFNQKLQTQFDTPITFMNRVAKISQHILRPKDYQLLKISSIMVVHLGLFEQVKPLIGTIQELAWANDIFKIPVIAFDEGILNPYMKHPWIDICCSMKVKTLANVCQVIRQFFLEF